MKVRALSPNVANFASRRDRWYRRIFGVGLGYRLIRVRIRVRSWLLNILRRKHHIVRMKAIERGHWYDTDTRMFEANFQLLVDYVEEELAWMQLISDNDARWYHRWFGVPVRRARDLALRMLDWEIQLGADSPEQSAAATKIKELYLWYRDVRPLRTDPYNAVPDRPIEWTEEEDGGFVMSSLHDDEEYMNAVHQANAKEEAYEQEDTDKLVELVRIRRMLWT